MKRLVERRVPLVSRYFVALAIAGACLTATESRALTYTCPEPKAASFNAQDQYLINLSNDVHAFYGQKCQTIANAIPHIQAQAAACQDESAKLKNALGDKSPDSMEGVCSKQLAARAAYLKGQVSKKFSDALRLPTVTCRTTAQPDVQASRDPEMAVTAIQSKQLGADVSSSSADTKQAEHAVQAVSAAIPDLSF